MTNEALLRLVYCAVIAIAIALPFVPKFRSTMDKRAEFMKQPVYSPDMPVFHLLLFALTLAVISLFLGGIETIMHTMISMGFPAIVHICLYFLLLLPLLPWLRRHFTAQACAGLWMIPNCLYFVMLGFTQLPQPRWVVTVPGLRAEVIFYLWLAGFLAVFGWKVIDHLRFRRHVLRDAHPVTTPYLLSLWSRAITEARVGNVSFELVTSPAVTSPLTVGLFRSATRVVLPRDVTYTAEELELIFRHELIHIERKDSRTKFFLMFCTALCWFNPLMWLAMDKCAQDLELSCDEAVLQNKDEAVRQQYALLLLDTAATGRGFTTCLSASAEAMRHRLKNVVEPVRRRSGALLILLVCFVLCASCGHVALAYGGENGEAVLFAGDAEACTLRDSISLAKDGGWTYNSVPEDADPAPLFDCLADLQLYRMTGMYTFDEREKGVSFWLRTPEGLRHIYLHDNFAEVIHVGEGSRTASNYYLPEDVDWDSIYDAVRAITGTSRP